MERITHESDPRIDAPRWADKRINKAPWLLYILLLAGMGVFAFYARESSRFEGDLAVAM